MSNVEKREITTELSQSYLDYAMSVIVRSEKRIRNPRHYTLNATRYTLPHVQRREKRNNHRAQPVVPRLRDVGHRQIGKANTEPAPLHPKRYTLHPPPCPT